MLERAMLARVATYRAVMLTRKGGPEVLEMTEQELREPGPGEARVRLRACGVGATDVMMRRGYYPYAPKRPFPPGYDIVGTVDALGSGASAAGVAVGDRVAALTVHGGYADYLYRGADELVKVPDGLDDAEVVALILNYVTAYQMIHRVANQRAGETALITGANGGVGQALLELLRVHGVTAIGAASKRAHDLVRGFGATPIDSRDADVAAGTHAVVPAGVDASYDALGGKYVGQCIRGTRRGGHVVAYGFSGTNNALLPIARGYAALYVGGPLAGRKCTFYGITQLFRKDKQPFKEDLVKLFDLLAQRKLAPKIVARMKLPVDARAANELQEKGGIDGKIVLIAEGPAAIVAAASS
jgi:NADPH2:quinone reductase